MPDIEDCANRAFLYSKRVNLTSSEKRICRLEDEVKVLKECIEALLTDRIGD